MTLGRFCRSAVIAALILYVIEGVQEGFNPWHWPTRDIQVLLTAWIIYLVILIGESWRRAERKR
jgi:hypothetical protein